MFIRTEFARSLDKVVEIAADLEGSGTSMVVRVLPRRFSVGVEDLPVALPRRGDVTPLGLVGGDRA